MSGPADRFDEETDALTDVRDAGSGAYLYEYTGVLAETGERVRIVTLAPALADVDAAVDAFARVSDRWYNASANATIRTVRDRGTEPRPWIAVPDHGGSTLATVHDELSPEGIGTVITETADALRTLGLYNTVHGHLSPDDISIPDVTGGAAELTVLLGGFGLEAAVRTAVGEFESTAYTAPELTDDSDRPTEQTDVYGLAAVTYFALTGHPPIEGDPLEGAIRDGPSSPPSAYDEAVPPELDDVVMQGLATRPADRHDSPYAFGRAFLSTFDPDEFSPADTGDETTGAAGVTTDSSGGDDTAPDDGEVVDDTVDSSESDGAVPAETPSPSDGDGSPSAVDDESADSEERAGPSVTRRVAVGLLGVGALGGAGWYLSRGQPTATAPSGGTPPAEPSASISVTPAAPSVGEDITFSATGSTTGEGVTVETYEWAVGATAQFSTGAERLTQSFSEAGTRTVRLRITDSRDRTATATTTLTVAGIPGASMFQYDAANTGANPAQTGPRTAISERWSYETDGAVYSSPAVVDGTVYIGARFSVYALSAADGTVQWRYETGGSLRACPTVIDGTVYVGSWDGTLYALSAADGTERWTYETGSSINGSAVVVDGTIYVGNANGTVYALSAADGSVQWSSRLGGDVDMSPAVAADTVYVGSVDGTMYALSAADGTEQWANRVSDSARYSAPTVVDGTLYVRASVDELYALSAADGTEQWSYRTGVGTPGISRVRSSPAVADGTVYAGDWSNKVYALSADSGTEQWSYRTGSEVFSSPAVVDGTVYVGSKDDNVYALSAADGTEQWVHETGGGVTSSPAVVDGTLYVGSGDRNVYALSEP